MRVYIAPADDIFAPFPDCTLCTWVGVPGKGMRLKYMSTACPVHQQTARILA